MRVQSLAVLHRPNWLKIAPDFPKVMSLIVFAAGVYAIGALVFYVASSFAAWAPYAYPISMLSRVLFGAVILAGWQIDQRRWQIRNDVLAMFGVGPPTDQWRRGTVNAYQDLVLLVMKKVKLQDPLSTLFASDWKLERWAGEIAGDPDMQIRLRDVRTRLHLDL